MEFTREEIRMISQTLSVPLMAFGADKLEAKIGSDGMQKARLLYENLDRSSVVEKRDMFFLVTTFLYSRDIIDWMEYPTLTGFSWEESTDLAVKMIKEIQQ